MTTRSDPIRVGFLSISIGSWKSGPVFRQMHQDPAFEPRLFILPIRGRTVVKDPAYMQNILRETFREQGLPFTDLSHLGPQQALAQLQNFKPDHLIFSNPNPLTYPKLHQSLAAAYRSAYVPYHHEVASYQNDQDQYNQPIHNQFWRIYSPHNTSRDTYASVRRRGSEGVVVTGLPCCAELLDPDPGAPQWKPQAQGKKRVIWAPHWARDKKLQWATIYEFGEAVRALAEKYQDQIQWAFRPHALLRAKLETHPNWGKAKTDDFYAFWRDSSFTQIAEGDYIPLFKQSDAMLHDSGSFLAEYLYVDKPVLYLRNEHTMKEGLNSFGQAARDACSLATSPDGIEAFLKQLIAGEDPQQETRRAFRSKNLLPYFEVSPAKQICDDMLSANNPPKAKKMSTYFENTGLLKWYRPNPTTRQFARMSYAQQGEDMLLRRILDRKLFLPRQYKGVYVDIGAYHPTSHSITRFLYDLGWKGLIADMSKRTISLFESQRPKDIAIHAGISSSDGKITSYSFGETHLANTCDPAAAKKFSQQSGKKPQIEEIPMRSLDSLFQEHSIQKVDFLNIDVEGLEMKVIKGIDFDRVAPSCIAFEQHNDNIEEVLEGELYQTLRRQGYKLAGSAVITHFLVKSS